MHICNLITLTLHAFPYLLPDPSFCLIFFLYIGNDVVEGRTGEIKNKNTFKIYFIKFSNEKILNF